VQAMLHRVPLGLWYSVPVSPGTRPRAFGRHEPEAAWSVPTRLYILARQVAASGE
jgi:hypothetical protein